MEFLKNNINGILGTVIFHLILLISFLFVQIKQIKVEKPDFIVLDFSNSPPPPLPEKKKIDLNKVIPGLNELTRRNVAVNTANKFEKDISTEDYLNELKKEFDIDNMDDAELNAMKDKYTVKKKEKGEKETLGNPDIKENETNISCHLAGRNIRYIHNPVYKCVGSAMVVLDIAVDVKGYVVNATVNNSASQTEDPCFFEEAIAAAKKSRFNADYTAPARAKGTMTYKFVAQ